MYFPVERTLNALTITVDGLEYHTSESHYCCLYFDIDTQEIRKHLGTFIG